MTKTATAVRIPTARLGPAGTTPLGGTFRRDVAGLLVLPLVLSLLVTACGAEETPLPHPTAVPAPRTPLAQVLAAVRTAPAIRSVPADLTPSLAAVKQDVGFDSDQCEAGPAAERIDACVFGDPAGSTKVVLYGDSHAGMWLPALSEIAQRRHWQLRFFGKPACPTPALEFAGVPCDKFRAYAEGQIQAEHPDLVLVANDSYGQKHGTGQPVTAAQWQSGLTRTLAELHRSGARVVVVGDTPVLTQSAPECLTAHAGNIAACVTTRAAATGQVWNGADRAAARATGSGYVSVVPWLCSLVCTPVIGSVLVYRNRFDLTATYSRMLNGVLESALLKEFPPESAPPRACVEVGDRLTGPRRVGGRNGSSSMGSGGGLGPVRRRGTCRGVTAAGQRSTACSGGCRVKGGDLRTEPPGGVTCEPATAVTCAGEGSGPRSRARSTGTPTGEAAFRIVAVNEWL